MFLSLAFGFAQKMQQNFVEVEETDAKFASVITQPVFIKAETQKSIAEREDREIKLIVAGKKPQIAIALCGLQYPSSRHSGHRRVAKVARTQARTC